MSKRGYVRCVFHPKLRCYVREAMREAGIVAQRIEFPKTKTVEEEIMYKVLDATAKIAAFEWTALSSFCLQCRRKNIEDTKIIAKTHPVVEQMVRRPPQPIHLKTRPAVKKMARRPPPPIGA